MTWYKKDLEKHGKEIAYSAAISLAVTLAFSLWYFITGKGFEWATISPISEPTLPLRFLSALVFVSLGRILYKLKFYYVLYFVFVIVLKAGGFYNKLKKVIWDVLTGIMGFVIVPWIIGVLNHIVSLFYNIGVFFVYIFPPLGLLIAALAACWIFWRVRQRWESKQALQNLRR